jgi:hypothetical protein
MFDAGRAEGAARTAPVFRPALAHREDLPGPARQRGVARRCGTMRELLRGGGARARGPGHGSGWRGICRLRRGGGAGEVEGRGGERIPMRRAGSFVRRCGARAAVTLPGFWGRLLARPLRAGMGIRSRLARGRSRVRRRRRECEMRAVLRQRLMQSGRSVIAVSRRSRTDQTLEGGGELRWGGDFSTAAAC